MPISALKVIPDTWSNPPPFGNFDTPYSKASKIHCPVTLLSTILLNQGNAFIISPLVKFPLYRLFLIEPPFIIVNSPFPKVLIASVIRFPKVHSLWWWNF